MEHRTGLPPLETLEAVLGAARLGSLSAAANELGITHGAVSRRVAMAERWAGLRLFERHGRGVRLTLDGERFAARIELAVAMLEDSRATDRTDHGLATIRVGVVQSFARLWLLPKLAMLEGSPPDLRIELEIDSRHMTLSDARIAIRLGRGGWPNVISEPLFREALRPVASRTIADALSGQPRIEDLLRFPILHDASEAGWRLWLADRGHAYEADGQSRTLPGHDLALLAAASGMGIALARLPYGNAFRQSLHLIPVHPATTDNPECFHVVMRPGPRHPAVERLLHRLREAARSIESAFLSAPMP
ncbi:MULTISPECIES: LysR substrate-binding domain-containing protein [unclassified Aureimonas]|uniref:LysR substrate-binding domain-containing protein n=1 Tax=unclassified Aureimonas TaxID=2615206 RepID=UPI0007016407|nr:MULTISPECIES: LysR substrate-binding domain-containing protein [unclassified Aureimonas]KQT65787.1 LysR family transcriptional regulator [Aureimonas sp. Leaf427]KQT74786.1 LysR family transcriptional regulator [Aureimonas sp. Leaf460]